MLAVLLCGAGPASAAGFVDAKSGFAVDPPQPFAVAPASTKTYDVAVVINSLSGSPSLGAGDSFLCQVGYKGVPENADFAQEDINLQVEQPEWLDNAAAALAQTFNVTGKGTFVLDGATGIEIVGQPKDTAHGAGVFISMIDTPSGRTTLNCATRPEELDSAVNQFRLIRAAITPGTKNRTVAPVRQIFVVTHTQSVHHVEGRVGGWYDTGLTAVGQRQAGQVADRLKVLTRGLDVEIVTSDLKRAAETAAIIGQVLGGTPTPDPDLREMSFGVAEGQPQDWLTRNQVPPSGNDPLDYRGVVKGETRRQVATRLYRSMDRIIARPCETQIIVTHGIAMSFVVASWIGMPLEAVGQARFPVKSGSITRLYADPYWRNRAVGNLGDVSHLIG